MQGPPLATMLLFGTLVLGTLACGAPPSDRPDAGSGRDAGRPADAGPRDGGAEDGAPGTPDAGAGTADAAAGGALCPPAGPYGGRPGQVAPELVLFDCDGVAHSLHALCEREAVWLFEFADWCPPCQRFAERDANRIYDRFAPEPFAAWMVISEGADFGPVDAAGCARIRDRYGIRMPVLVDPEGALQTAFGVAPNEVHVILRRGAVIDWVGHYAGDEVEPRLAAIFSAP